MGWILWDIMTLTWNCWSLEDRSLMKRLNKQGTRRRITTATKQPRWCRLLCWPDSGGYIILAKVVKPFCLGVYFLCLDAHKTACGILVPWSGIKSQGHGSRSMEFFPLDHQGIPFISLMLTSTCPVALVQVQEVLGITQVRPCSARR